MKTKNKILIIISFMLILAVVYTNYTFNTKSKPYMVVSVATYIAHETTDTVPYYFYSSGNLILNTTQEIASLTYGFPTDAPLNCTLTTNAGTPLNISQSNFTKTGGNMYTIKASTLEALCPQKGIYNLAVSYNNITVTWSFFYDGMTEQKAYKLN